MLEEIVAWKRTEVAERKNEILSFSAMSGGEKAAPDESSLIMETRRIYDEFQKGGVPKSRNRRFEKAILNNCGDTPTCTGDNTAENKQATGKVSVISEIKRCSPSKGSLSDIVDPVPLAIQYQSGGAAAISCLTDAKYFKGSIADLRAVAQAVDIPVMRKDFVVDEIQIAEAKAAGASAVLLIVAVLDTQLTHYLNVCEAMDIDALVEVHDEAELDTALSAGSRLVGVNSRNLKTFVTDLAVAERLAAKLSSQVAVKVAESGIRDVEDVKRVAAAGYNAVLVGESLVKSSNPSQAIRGFRLMD